MEQQGRRQFRWPVWGAVLVVTVTACSTDKEEKEHYVSAPAPLAITGRKIDLQEVQQAFWDTRVGDFKGWMSHLEQRANFLYHGRGTVHLDATRQGRRMTVIGYIERNSRPGYQEGDERLFRLEHSGDLQETVRQLRTRMEDTQLQIQQQFRLLLEQTRQNQKQFELAIEQTKQNQKQFQQIIDQVTRSTRSLARAMDNIVAITDSAKRISGGVEGMVTSTAPEMKVIVHNVSVLTRSVDTTMRSVDGTIRSVDGTINGVQRMVTNPDTQRNLTETARNVAALTQRVNLLLDDVRKITGDSSVRDDLKGLLHETHRTMQNVSSLTGSLAGGAGGDSRLSFDASGELLGSAGDPAAPHLQANLLGLVKLNGSFIRLGLQEAGGRNLLDLQYGLRPTGLLDLRFGLIRGLLGVGSDFHLTRGTDLGVNLFDARTPIVRATLSQHLFDNWGLTGFYQNSLLSGTQEYGMGISWRLINPR